MSLFGIPLDSARLNSALENSYWRVSVVDITGSTQTDLTTAVRKNGAKHGEVLVTEFQSAGRGRLDRSFVAQPGTALLFSFFIKPDAVKNEWGWLPLLAGQAICKSMEEVLKITSEMRPLLKWPNDILINDRKVGGILAERIDSENGPGVVVGIGLNFFATREELPVSNATSLALEGFTGTSRADLLVSFLKNMSAYLERWESDDFSLIQEYIDRSATIGKAISIELPSGEKVESVAVSIARSGALILENGSQITVGDVIHLRAK
ncbi:MAG: biotin--[acetyl-CoA-carboxylase] ligase [Candidatus Nanopelagicaceae bacterium]|nr:biotin--[acetyl-CoA-carboxylase] ligase [Candidatus Nanopelagicaceae bacterium]